MRTLDEIKQSVAIEYGLENCPELEGKFTDKMLSYTWQDVCKDYATEAIKAEREH